MFQDFSTSSNPSEAAARTRKLQGRLADLGLDAVLVPRADEHMGEYVPPCAERLQWLTGFTGSAGLAAIGRRFAVLFVDGRYTLQVGGQVDTKLFETVLGDTLAGIAEKVAADENQRKGEFVVVVRGCEDDTAARLVEGQRLYAKLAEHLKPSVAAKLAADISGAPRKALYGGESV